MAAQGVEVVDCDGGVVGDGVVLGVVVDVVWGVDVYGIKVWEVGILWRMLEMRLGVGLGCGRVRCSGVELCGRWTVACHDGGCGLAVVGGS